MFYKKILKDFLFFFFAAFVLCSTFSIALAQVTAGFALIIFILMLVTTNHKLTISQVKWIAAAIAAMIVWQIISAIGTPTTIDSLKLMKEEWLFLLIPIGMYAARDEKRRVTLLTVLAVGMIIVSIYGIFYYFTGYDLIRSSEPVPAPVFGYRVSGLFKYGVTFGNLAAMASAALIAYTILSKSWLSKRRWNIFLAGSIASVLMTILSFGRSPLAALVVAVVAMFIFLGRRWLKISIIVMVVLLILFAVIPGVGDRFVNEFDKEAGGTYEGGRIFIWKNSFKVIGDHPVFGVGKGNFKPVYATHLREDIHEVRKVNSPHNDILVQAATFGIPGALIYLVLWFAVISYLFRAYYKAVKENDSQSAALLLAALCGSICFFATSMFHGAFYDDKIRHLLMFFWGIGLSGVWRRKPVSGT